MLRTMEKAGLVERRPDEADQRLTRVRAHRAPAAQREQKMGVAVGEYVNATFATLPEDDRRELARLLSKLGDSIERAAAAERPAAAGRDDPPPAHSACAPTGGRSSS